MSQANPPPSAEDLTHGPRDHACAANSPNTGPGSGEDRTAQGEASLPGTSPKDPNPPADTAPSGPTTAYEYARGDRGAAATEHERQVKESEAGPSRDDVARGG